MPARRDTRIEAARLRRLSPLQTVEDQSRIWGICVHSCTWREGLAPAWRTEWQGCYSPRGLPGSRDFLSTNGSLRKFKRYVRNATSGPQPLNMPLGHLSATRRLAPSPAVLAAQWLPQPRRQPPCCMPRPGAQPPAAGGVRPHAAAKTRLIYLYVSFPPASYAQCWACTWSSLPTCGLGVRRVGFESPRLAPTGTNNLLHEIPPNSKVPGLPWRDKNSVGKSYTFTRIINSLTLGDCSKDTGLHSSCPRLMQGLKGLLTPFALGFSPHVERNSCFDLILRAYTVNTLLHLPITPIATFHRIGGRG